VLRTLGDPVSLWESLLAEEVLRLPAELRSINGTPAHSACPRRLNSTRPACA